MPRATVSHRISALLLPEQQYQGQDGVPCTYCFLHGAWLPHRPLSVCRVEGPVPALTARQWRLLLSALIAALSFGRLPALRACFPRMAWPDAALPGTTAYGDEAATPAGGGRRGAGQGRGSDGPIAAHSPPAEPGPAATTPDVAEACLSVFLGQLGFEMYHWHALVDLLTCPDL